MFWKNNISQKATADTICRNMKFSTKASMVFGLNVNLFEKDVLRRSKNKNLWTRKKLKQEDEGSKRR